MQGHPATLAGWTRYGVEFRRVLLADTAFPLSADAAAGSTFGAHPAALVGSFKVAGLDGDPALGAVDQAGSVVASGLGLGGHRSGVGHLAQQLTELGSAVGAGVALGVGEVGASREGAVGKQLEFDHGRGPCVLEAGGAVLVGGGVVCPHRPGGSSCRG